MTDDTAEWTEGVCGDGAVFLRDGEPQTLSEVLEYLNKAERLRAENAKLRQSVDLLTKQCGEM